MQPAVVKCGIGQMHVICHTQLSVAAFRENKYINTASKYIAWHIYAYPHSPPTSIHINYQMMLREKIIEQCLQAMKRDDVKKELKQMFHPVIDMIMQEIYPYIYLSVVFVMISFLLTLGIFVLLMRTSYFKQFG